MKRQNATYTERKEKAIEEAQNRYLYSKGLRMTDKIGQSLIPFAAIGPFAAVAAGIYASHQLLPEKQEYTTPIIVATALFGAIGTHIPIIYSNFRYGKKAKNFETKYPRLWKRFVSEDSYAWAGTHISNEQLQKIGKFISNPNNKNKRKPYSLKRAAIRFSHLRDKIKKEDLPGNEQGEYNLLERIVDFETPGV